MLSSQLAMSNAKYVKSEQVANILTEEPCEENGAIRPLLKSLQIALSLTWFSG